MENLDDLWGRIWRYPTRPALLVGSGVSIDPPSSLPSGLSLTTRLLKYLSPTADACERLTKLAFPDEFIPGRRLHLLRFEHIIQTLQDAIDPDLNLIRGMLPLRPPNSCHRAIAVLLRAGCPVVTTNFDMGLEGALDGIDSYEYAIEGIDPWPADAGVPELAFLGKLHGSLYDREHRLTYETIQSTIPSILSGGAFRMSRLPTAGEGLRFFGEIAHQRPLVVVGYSGFDDFDVVPQLGRYRRRCQSYGLIIAKRHLWKSPHTEILR